jgi:hypothetical protein
VIRLTLKSNRDDGKCYIYINPHMIQILEPELSPSNGTRVHMVNSPTFKVNETIEQIIWLIDN